MRNILDGHNLACFLQLIFNVKFHLKIGQLKNQTLVEIYHWWSNERLTHFGETSPVNFWTTKDGGTFVKIKRNCGAWVRMRNMLRGGWETDKTVERSILEKAFAPFLILPILILLTWYLSVYIRVSRKNFLDALASLRSILWVTDWLTDWLIFSDC